MKNKLTETLIWTGLGLVCIIVNVYKLTPLTAPLVFTWDRVVVREFGSFIHASDISLTSQLMIWSNFVAVLVAEIIIFKRTKSIYYNLLSLLFFVILAGYFFYQALNYVFQAV